jgi:hypothetical protein
VEIYGETIITGDVFKTAVYYSPILFLNGLTYTPIDFYDKQTIFEGREQILLFLKLSFSKFEKYIRARTMDQEARI